MINDSHKGSVAGPEWEVGWGGMVSSEGAARSGLVESRFIRLSEASGAPRRSRKQPSAALASFAPNWIKTPSEGRNWVNGNATRLCAFYAWLTLVLSSPESDMN